MEYFGDPYIMAGNRFVQILFTILILLLIQVVLRQALEKIIYRAISLNTYHTQKEAEQRAKTVVSMLQTALTFVLWVIGVIIILTILGINLAALLTGAGLVGVLIGFGAQSIVKDFLAGIFIILENQYRVGDVVKINGATSGVVDSITIRITKLRDMDGALHFIPNGQITMVSNMTMDFSNVNLDIDVPYNADIKKVEKVVNDLGKKLSAEPSWKEKIIEPIKFLRVNNYTETAVTIKVLGKVKPGKQWAVAGEFRRRLHAEFDKNDISITTPKAGKKAKN